MLGILALLHLPLLTKIVSYCVDAKIYLAGAYGILNGLGYSHGFHLDAPPNGFYPPMQSLWLALWWRLGGDFPDNVPALNAGMILLSVATAGLAFLLWQRAGLSRPVAAGCTLAWVLSPSWLGWVLGVMSDMGFTALCLLGIYLWQTWNSRSPVVSWLILGTAFGLAYLWRTAALPLIAVAGLGALLQTQCRRWQAALVFALPTGAALVTWKIMSAGTFGYGALWQKAFAEGGGWPGYRQLLWDNLIYSLKGLPFWEMILPSAARIPHWTKAGQTLTEVYQWGLGALFWLLVGLAVRGYRRSTTGYDRLILLGALGYVASVFATPFTAGNYHRYFFLLLPFFLVWLWRAVAEPRDQWWRRSLGIGLAGALLSNVALSTVVFRRDAEKVSMNELKEVAEWSRQNVPPEARVAANVTLPFATWFAFTRRPVVVDYLDAIWFGSPITHEAQRYVRADFALLESNDRRAETMPGLFTEVFRSSGGSFRLFRINPEAEAAFREKRGIPPPIARSE